MLGAQAPCTEVKPLFLAIYNQSDAEGFIHLFGLPLKVKALLDIEGLGASSHDQPDYAEFPRD